MSSDIPSISAAQSGISSVAGKAAMTATTAQANAAAAKTAERPLVNFDPKAMRQEMQEAIDKLNEQMKRGAYNLNFTMDEVANAVVIKVRNLQTGDVIRQIPNEAALRFAHNLEDLKGLFNDEST